MLRIIPIFFIFISCAVPIDFFGNEVDIQKDRIYLTKIREDNSDKDKLHLISDNLDPITVETLLRDILDESLLNELIHHLKVCDGSYYGRMQDNSETDIEQKTIDLLEKIDGQIK